MSILLSLEAVTSRLALRAAILFLSLAACLTIYQVVTRFFFGHPSSFSEAAARTAMIWSVMLGVAPTIRNGSMIAVDVVQNNVADRYAKILSKAAKVLSLLFFCVLLGYGIVLVMRVSSQLQSSLNISIAWAYSAIPVGAFFAIVALLAQCFRPETASADSALKETI